MKQSVSCNNKGLVEKKGFQKKSHLVTRVFSPEGAHSASLLLILPNTGDAESEAHDWNLHSHAMVEGARSPARSSRLSPSRLEPRREMTPLGRRVDREIETA